MLHVGLNIRLQCPQEQNLLMCMHAPGYMLLVMALVAVCTLQNTLNVYARPGIYAQGHGPGSGMLSTEYS